MNLEAPHTSQINNNEIYRYNNERRELLTTLYEGEDLPTISSEMCFLDLAYHGSFDRSWRLNRVGRRRRGSIWTIPMSLYWDPTDAIHYLKLEIHSWATNGTLSLKLLLTDVSMDSTHCVMFQSFSSKSLERGWVWYIWDSWQFLMRSLGAAIAGSCQLLSKLGMDAAEPGALIWRNRIQTASLTIWQIPILIFGAFVHGAFKCSLQQQFFGYCLKRHYTEYKRPSKTLFSSLKELISLAVFCWAW